MFFWYRAKNHGFWIEITSFHCCRLPFRSYKPLYVFWGMSGWWDNPCVRYSFCSWGRPWEGMAALWGGEVYLGLYDIVFPVVRHNIDMPRFKNKKGARSVDGFRWCSSFSACWLIMQCWWAAHSVLMSRLLSIFMKNESNRLNLSVLCYGKNVRHAYLGRAGLPHLWNPRRLDFIHAVLWL